MRLRIFSVTKPKAKSAANLTDAWVLMAAISLWRIGNVFCVSRMNCYSAWISSLDQTHLSILNDSNGFLRRKQRHHRQIDTRRIDEMDESTNLILLILHQSFIAHSVNFEHVNVCELVGVKYPGPREYHSTSKTISFRQGKNVSGMNR